MDSKSPRRPRPVSGPDWIRAIAHPPVAGGYAPPMCAVSAPCNGDVAHANGLWIANGRLPRGEKLVWDGRQGDQAIYLAEGMLELAGRPCRQGDAILIDAGARCTLRALTDSSIIHFGSLPGDDDERPCPAPAADAHIVAAADAPRFKSSGPRDVEFLLEFFADGTGATNRAALFSVSVTGPSFAPPHSHSRDELIHVIDGSVRSGTISVAAGETLAVAKDMIYSFRTDRAATFLNFRRGASTIRMKQGDRPETIEIRRQEPAGRGEVAPID